MTSVSEKTWQAPGPGMWEQDESHQSAPYSAYMDELLRAHFNTGIREGAERYGLLVDYFDVRSLEGWMFMRIRMVGAPEKPGPLPPKWLFKLMFRLHPGLRARSRNASEALAGGFWRKDAEWWIAEGRDPFRNRLAALQSVGLSSLSDAALRSHMAEVMAAVSEGLRIHFRDALAHWIGVGDWLRATAEWTGVAPEEALGALQGASPFSVDAIEYLDRIADAAREAPAALEALQTPGDATLRLAALRASSAAVAQALDAYLAEHGWRIYTGFDMKDRATIEMPENILDAVASRVRDRSTPAKDRSFAEGIRARVPQAHLREYDDLFETAQILYGVRDDDAGPCAHWTLGLVRRFLLEAGARLAREGRLHDADHVFDARPGEVDALLGGQDAVSGDELARRGGVRMESAKNRPPSRLGEDEGPPPPDDWMPAAVARVNAALMTAMAIEYTPPVEATAANQGPVTILKGSAASRGRHEGRACVVSGPDDFSKLQPGDVLVAPFTTTSYNVVLPLLGAVVTDKGGVLSHAAIVAREYAIPAVVNTVNATAVITDGARLRVDGEAGTVEILDPAPETETAEPKPMAASGA